ncbi:hypothetical protein F511_38630 [Dorcoceras hygrometricum]|uniref:Uncharacterized protein n=1 Tax=Dorcoceras hygrometricum TaxID=472368 RepID=A0A2Z7A3Y8_9LAMI|nr:hypothetical protein F511_38630 [Dorcoceras hygrometricum]
MASSLVSNTNQVHFASVLAMDNSEMVAMFETLVASGLNGFLGCMSDIFESALIEFYHNASVQDDKVVSTVQGKMVEISEEIFARTFQLPVEGLIDINEVPKDLIFDALTEFSFTGEQLTTSCKKRELKIEYRLLSDIMAKCIIVKASSFDAVTHERYIAINDKIAVDSVEGLAGKYRVKKTPVKRAASKNRPAVAIEEQVVKRKRTLKGKAAPSKAKLELVSIALDAEPIQTIDPTSADDVDTIIETVLAESSQLDTDVGSPVVQKTDEIEHWFDLSYEEFTARQDNKIVESTSETDEEQDTVAYEPSVGEQQLQTFVEPEVAKEIEMETVLADPVITKSDDILVEIDESPAATTAKDIYLAIVTDVGQFSFKGKSRLLSPIKGRRPLSRPA